jgi:phosphatidylinositol glycan class V
MLKSAWQALEGRTNINKTQDIAHITQDKAVSKPNIQDNQQGLRADALLFRLALPQLALASAALTTFHVQVITRLSSGYPLWYLVLAQDVLDDKRVAKWVVRWFVMYSIIQAVLFVAFLPPA